MLIMVEVGVVGPVTTINRAYILPKRQPIESSILKQKRCPHSRLWTHMDQKIRSSLRTPLSLGPGFGDVEGIIILIVETVHMAKKKW